MKTKMFIYRPDKPREDRDVDLPLKPRYEVLRDIVQPIIGEGVPVHFHDMEHVAVLFEGQRADMFVSENGRASFLAPDQWLPRNERATAIYRAANLAGMTAAPKIDDPETLPWIAGTAVVFDRIVWS